MAVPYYRVSPLLLHVPKGGAGTLLLGYWYIATHSLCADASFTPSPGSDQPQSLLKGDAEHNTHFICEPAALHFLQTFYFNNFIQNFAFPRRDISPISACDLREVFPTGDVTVKVAGISIALVS